MAVILGEAIWNLIVSVMNNLVAPWLGGVMGQTSGLPLSFTRDYDYPDLFLSVIEFCVAAIVALSINYFLQPRRARVKVTKPSGVAPEAVWAPAMAPAAPREVVPAARPAAVARPAMAKPAAQEMRLEIPVSSAPPVVRPNPAPIAPPVAEPVAAKPAPVPAVKPAAPPVAASPKPTPAAPPPESPKPAKPRQVYYNIVGEPVLDDED